MIFRRLMLFAVLACGAYSAPVRSDAQPASSQSSAASAQTSQQPASQPAQSQAQASVSSASGTQPTLSASDLQTIQAKRAARHKQSEDLAAQLQEKLSTSLAAVTAAQQQVSRQDPASMPQASSSAQQQSAPSTPAQAQPAH